MNCDVHNKKRQKASCPAIIGLGSPNNLQRLDPFFCARYALLSHVPFAGFSLVPASSQMSADALPGPRIASSFAGLIPGKGA